MVRAEQKSMFCVRILEEESTGGVGGSHRPGWILANLDTSYTYPRTTIQASSRVLCLATCVIVGGVGVGGLDWVVGGGVLWEGGGKTTLPYWYE